MPLPTLFDYKDVCISLARLSKLWKQNEENEWFIVGQRREGIWPRQVSHDVILFLGFADLFQDRNSISIERAR